MNTTDFYTATSAVPRSKPGVTVGIPAYKAQMCLIDAIDSVYEQGLPYDQFEVIVSDDKYPAGDLTAQAGHERVFREIARRKAAEPEKYRNLRVIQSGENGLNNGPSAARNAIIHAAQFEFIAGLDADDMYVFDPEFLADNGSFLHYAIKRLMGDERIALVDCGFYMFGSGRDLSEEPGIMSVYDMDKIITNMWMSNKAMFRRSDALHPFVGGYDESLKTREDSHFFAKYMAGRIVQGKKAWGVKLEQPHYLYRNHPEGADRVSNRANDREAYRLKTIQDALPYYQRIYGRLDAAEIARRMKREWDIGYREWVLGTQRSRTTKEQFEIAAIHLREALWCEPKEFLREIRIDPRSAAWKRLRRLARKVKDHLEIEGLKSDARHFFGMRQPVDHPSLTVMGINPFLD
ncbi:MAG TPA: glycosyltransferase family A protein [Alphaproteobacteria bacterium]|nr:glycosyltransferase family A protein [Alphaproteobacteria bacterium]